MQSGMLGFPPARQRGRGIDVYDTAGAGSWPWPAGVHIVKATLIGAGGSNNAAGGTSTLTYGDVSLSATGGGSGLSSGTGGTATGGDLNIPGMDGLSPGSNRAGIGGAPGLGYGAGGDITDGRGYGAGGSAPNGALGGGGGATCVVMLERIPGAGDVSFVLGAGASGTNFDGTDGAVIFEYWPVRT